MFVAGGFVALAVLAAASAGLFWLHRQNQTALWLDQAETAFDRGDWKQARKWYEWYLNRVPDDLDALDAYARTNLQFLESRRSALQRAATAYLQVLRYKPEQPELVYELLGLYDKMGSAATLEYYARQFLSRYPEDVVIRASLAKALDGVGRGAEALEMYQGLVSEDAASPQVYEALATLLRDRDDGAWAIEVLDRGIAQYPESASMRLVRARYYSRAHDWEAVESELREAARLDPDEADILAAQAQAAVARREWARARDLCDRALAKEPENPDTCATLARICSELGEAGRGIEVLERIDPLARVDNPGVFITLAELQIATARYQDARETAAAYRAAYPEQKPIADYLEARELLAQGDPEAAAELLASVTEIRPGFTPARFYFAVAQLASGRRASGRSTLETYLARHPEDERAQTLLAQVSGHGQTAEAIAARAEDLMRRGAPAPEVLVSTAFALLDATLWEPSPERYVEMVRGLLGKAVSGAPESPVGYRGLAEMHVALGELEDAREVLGQALEAGIPEGTLSIASASVALAENDLETASRHFRTYVTAPDMDPDSIAAWSALYAQRGYLEEMIGLLTDALDALEPPTRARIEIERATLAARTGQYEQAWEWIREAVERAKAVGGLDAVVRRAQADLAQRLLDKATPEGLKRARLLLADIRQADPEDPNGYAVEGLLLLRESPSSYEEARARFEKAIEGDPGNAIALAGLAQVCRARGDLEGAVEYTARAVAAAPQEQRLRLESADLSLRTGRYAEAERALRRLLAARPDDPLATELLARTFLATGRVDAAEALLGRLEQEEGDPAARARLALLHGELLMARGAPDEAVALLRRQVESAPDDLAVLRRYAGALAKQGRVDEATRVLEEHAARHEEGKEAWVAAAELHLRADGQSSLEGASRALTRALLADPGYLPAVRLMIEVQARSGNRVQALSLCDRYLDSSPNDSDVLYQKARLLAADRESLPGALSAIERAIAQQRRPEYVYVRGMVRLSMGQAEGALADLQSIAEDGPRASANLELALASAYLEVGRLDLATAYYDSALEKIEAGLPADETLVEKVRTGLQTGTTR